MAYIILENDPPPEAVRALLTAAPPKHDHGRQVHAMYGRGPSGQRKEKPCVTCCSSGMKGHLWIGGNDYLECPDCGGTGTLVLYERKIDPPRHFAVNGFKPLTLQRKVLP